MILGNDGALQGRLIAIVILTVISGGSFTLGYFVGTTTLMDESRELVVRNIEEEPYSTQTKEQAPEAMPSEVIEEQMEAMPDSTEVPEVEETTSQAEEKPKEIKIKKRALKKQAQNIYSVQSGVFKEKSYAESFTMKLKKRGYGAFVERSGEVFVVKVGKFESKEEAESLVQKLKEAEGIEGFVVESPG